MLISVLALAFSPLLVTLAAAPPPAERLPHVGALEPDRAAATIRIRPGFRLELAAAEPLVQSPVALSFDENGRLFVAEMRDYPERGADHIGRIRMLVDSDGDGRFDRATVFADGLTWPTAVMWVAGGVLVGATPDLIFLRDTDGDGKADERRVLYTGFAAALPKPNVQGVLNSLVWGLDNRVHGASGSNGARLRSLLRPGDPTLELRGRDFVLDPRTWALETETGGGQFGLTFDDAGRKFICDNSHHIRTLAYDARYAGRNPQYDLPPPVLDVAADGPAPEVYRLSAEEPWRVLRTRWRVAGQYRGPVEGGGRASGYITSASGITIYRGDALGPTLVGDAFIAEPSGNLVHHKKVRPAGALVVAERPADEARTEFLASSDNWFRPVAFATGPDGALYVADMYREIIEHPDTIPESIKAQFDLGHGHDRGRIWRIVPAGFVRPPAVRLGAASTAELVAALAHPNGWRRDTAARLIFERQDRAAIPLLASLRRGPTPLGRLHALHALDGLGALDEGAIAAALGDADARVRLGALRLAERRARERRLPTPLWTRVARLARDPAPEVRYQLALTLSLLDGPGKIDAMAAVLARDGAQPWTRAALLNAATDHAADLLGRAARERQLAPDARAAFVAALLGVIGARGDAHDLTAATRLLARTRDVETFAMARALGDGLGRGQNATPAALDLRRLMARARVVAADRAAPEPARAGAVALLALAPWAEAAPIVLPLLAPATPEPLQRAALATIDRMAAPELGPQLVARLGEMGPRTRADAIRLLARRPERATALLAAVEAGRVRVREIEPLEARTLRTSTDEALRARAVRVLGSAPAGNRGEVVRRMLPALALAGDAGRGKVTFGQRCAPCHRLGDLGSALGPDLAAARTGGREAILTSLLDPNRDVPPAYLAYQVETTDGATQAGVIVAETPAAVTLRQAGGVEASIPRPRIKSMRAEGQSLMPEGLEEGLALQDVADLLAFVMAP